MSLIDDLKTVMMRHNIPENVCDAVIADISKRFGGSKWYIRQRKNGHLCD